MKKIIEFQEIINGYILKHPTAPQGEFIERRIDALKILYDKIGELLDAEIKLMVNTAYMGDGNGE